MIGQICHVVFFFLLLDWISASAANAYDCSIKIQLLGILLYVALQFIPEPAGV